MSTLVLIPARYDSQRYPGKPLAPIRGAAGAVQTLLERTWRAAMAVSGVDRVAVATDDTRIEAEARRIEARRWFAVLLATAVMFMTYLLIIFGFASASGAGAPSWTSTRS